MHVRGLPPDSAIQRKRQGAPMGWDNTTEMTAGVVDVLERIAHGLAGSRDQPPRVQRPYEAPVEPETVSLAELPGLFKEA